MKYVMITEVVVCILKMMVFDIMSGLSHAITVWIDFMAYSTMQWLQTVIVLLITIMDLVMLVMAWSRSEAYQAVINSHWLSQISFWFFIVFYSAKIIIAMVAFVVWRNEYRYEHGHTQICCNTDAPVLIKERMGIPPAGAGPSSGMSRVSGFNQRDEEAGGV